MATGGWINKGETMARLADNPVFYPVLDLYDELTYVVERYNYNEDLLETNLKVVLMKAYQKGQREILESMKNANN